jgi:phosphoesterase RecJ-like protein
MQHIEALQALLSTPQEIIITTHQRPDADALGSSLGLMLYLQKNGHDVKVITPTDYPNFLKWMKGNEQVVIYGEQTKDLAKDLMNKAGLIFCLDFSALNRIDELGDLVRDASADKVLIDHHLEPEDFAKFRSWDTGAAATAELVYDFIVDMGDELLIDADIAECLYAGILTDTGSFKHPNVTQHVFEVCASLVAKGADSSKVSKLIYDTNSEDRLRLLGYCLSEKLQVLPEYNTAFFVLSAEELKRFNAQAGDTEGLVNYALSMAGIKVAALMKDSGGMIKMSFRSIGDFSVNEFARKHFNGGGHKNAAGGRSDDSLEDTAKKFENLLIEYKSTLNT